MKNLLLFVFLSLASSNTLAQDCGSYLVAVPNEGESVLCREKGETPPPQGLVEAAREVQSLEGVQEVRIVFKCARSIPSENPEVPDQLILPVVALEVFIDPYSDYKKTVNELRKNFPVVSCIVP